MDLGAMIKLDQEPRSWLAQRAIGAGFQSVLFADIRNADDARECVRVVRPDTPHGLRHVRRRRPAECATGAQAASADYIRALEEIVVVLMIEKKSAVDKLDEILAVPGIDMIQWGPSDYAMSIGRPGGWYDDDVREVERDVLARCLAAGIQPRAEIVEPSEAQPTISTWACAISASGRTSTSCHDWLNERGAAPGRYPRRGRSASGRRRPVRRRR